MVGFAHPLLGSSDLPCQPVGVNGMPPPCCHTRRQSWQCNHLESEPDSGSVRGFPDNAHDGCLERRSQRFLERTDDECLTLRNIFATIRSVHLDSLLPHQHHSRNLYSKLHPPMDLSSDTATAQRAGESKLLSTKRYFKQRLSTKVFGKNICF